MAVKQRVKRALRPVAKRLEEPTRRLARGGLPTYEGDGLTVWSKPAAFLSDPRFVRAYQKGMDSGQQIADELHIEWRVHVILWAATHALKVPGDFVECGVNTGIYSLALADFVDLDSTDKKLWLFDTFAGIPEDQMSERERPSRIEENARKYTDCWQRAVKNFAPFANARLVKGKVPDTLGSVQIGSVAYLSIDMNIVAPEIAAIRYFWPKLSSGAVVVLDDYGWRTYREQKDAMDAFAAEVGVPILLLPTGQGVIFKP